MRRSLVVAGAAVVAIALSTVAACGSSDAPATAPPTEPATTAAGAPAAPAAAPGATVPGVPALTGNPTDVNKQSQAKAGTGQPPTKLVTQDIVVGKGPAATLQNTVDVRYSGTLYSDGTLFDSSWSRGNDPVSFPLDGVVPGFAQGIAGMQPGGRRVIVIPPALGYGANTNGPIPGGSTLVFVVDLVSAS
ncbi:MAG TPA: FKBP-type peptidyl-prolyl cis-trans isomerase [Pseudonocardia sp.]|nr:FKBP-type peptidyl-prolyl cis-trans isomerase [Pseudonocardia sp.]